MMEPKSKVEISSEGDTIISKIGTLSTAHSPRLPSIKDFSIIKIISRGAFGQVFLGYKNTDESRLFAIEVMRKSEMVNKNMISQVITERNVLALSTSAYCVRLFYSLQTPLHVFLVLEDTIACNLKSLIAAYGNCRESAALFYCAEITLALEYLHSRGIIRHDISPNKLLLSQTGHAKLTDFGLSKIEISRDLELSDFIASSPRTPDQLLSLTSHLTFASNEPKFRNCLMNLMDAISRHGSPDALNASLESLPTEILEKMFAKMDDFGLLNMANTCTRFEAIAQTVFSKRYANSFFHINDERHDGEAEMYMEIFNRFGSHIKAIQLNGIDGIDSTHWASKILQSQINKIEKLTYKDCFLDANGIISQPLNNATHLVFHDVGVFSTDHKPEHSWLYTPLFDLPECRNLVELEIRETHCSRESLEKTIRENPALQRIVLKNFDDCDDEDDEGRFPIIDSIAEHLPDVKELILLNDFGGHSQVSASHSVVNSFKHLESLFMELNDSNMLELVARLANECKSLKHLGLTLHCHIDIDFKILCQFQQLESLHSALCESIPIGLLVEDFPKLRHLTIGLETTNKDLIPSLLPLLKQIQSLERITMVFEDYLDAHLPTFVSAEFFEQFIATIAVTDKPNAQIEVVTCNYRNRDAQMLGLVCRKKSTHWEGCHKPSTKNLLLNLPDHPKNQSSDNILLDAIFDYLK